MLKNKRIAFTGTLLKMPRSKATKAVIKHGGIVTNHVNKSTDILVIADTAACSGKLAKAIEIAESGGWIQLMREQEFYDEIRA